MRFRHGVRIGGCMLLGVSAFGCRHSSVVAARRSRIFVASVTTFEEAEARGLLKHAAFTAELRTILHMINPQYRDKEFEYITAGTKVMPNLVEFHEQTERFLESLLPFCCAQRERHESEGG